MRNITQTNIQIRHTLKLRQVQIVVIVVSRCCDLKFFKKVLDYYKKAFKYTKKSENNIFFDKIFAHVIKKLYLCGGFQSILP